jgi:photosystem II stability/assembly factor-like uncharacterized protein
MRPASAARLAVPLAVSLVLACAPRVRAAELRDNLYGVRALSATDAWAVGNFGAIQHTTDGGKTWREVDSGTRMPLFGIDFGDPQHAWAVGKSALVLRSQDGGKTWKTQATPLSIEKHLFKVRAIDANTAWAVGDWGTIIATKDGGVTWEDRSLGVTPVKTEEQPGRTTTTITDDVILYDVSFPDPEHGFIVGEFGTLLVSSDGGATWAGRAMPTEKTLFGVDFDTPDRGWVVGMDGLVLRTGDGGRTWEVQHGKPETAGVEDINFRETLKNPGMYAVRVEGDYGVVVGDVGMVLVSIDGGRTWSRRELPAEDRLVWLRDVSLAPGTGGFTVGAAGFDAAVDRADVVLPDGRRSTTPTS